jgi:uncharacterized protein (TIGR04255 family)
MEEQPHYPNAPIVEAIIDLRVKQADGVGVNNFSQFVELNRDLYPYKEEVSNILGKAVFQVGESFDSQSSITSHPIGFRLTDKNKRYVVQARIDGFTFSALEPYDCWDTFCGEAKRLWENYKEISTVENIWRVAVRYINRLNLPITDGGLDLQDFLATSPLIAKTEGQQVSGFFMQLQLWQADLNSMLILNEAVAPPSDDLHMSILFDVDLFQEKVTEPWSIKDEQSVWDLLNILRKRKNAFFEASITDKIRELIR